MRSSVLVGTAVGIALVMAIGTAVALLGKGQPAGTALAAAAGDRTAEERVASGGLEPAAPLAGSRQYVAELGATLGSSEFTACKRLLHRGTGWIQVEFVAVEIRSFDSLKGVRAFVTSSRPSSGERRIYLPLADDLYEYVGRAGSMPLLLFQGPGENDPKVSVCIGPPTLGYKATLRAIVTGYTFEP